MDLVVVKVRTLDGHVPDRLTGEVDIYGIGMWFACPGGSPWVHQCNTVDSIVLFNRPTKFTIRIADESGAYFAGTFEPRYEKYKYMDPCLVARIEVELDAGASPSARIVEPWRTDPGDETSTLDQVD